MRKINKKNKISFNVFGILTIAFLAVFAFAGYTVIRQNANKEYHVSEGSVVYDNDMDRVDMSDAGTIRKKWDSQYYLTLNNGGSYCLGEHNVILDGGTDTVSVIGDAYQVFTDGSVLNMSGKTDVASSQEISFFKLDDRNYLFSAPVITDEEQGFQTEKYVQISMDRSGNALLTNDEVNMKTVTPMTLTAGDVIFDIPNERLIYKDQTVDLKAINGSTNEYVPPVEDLLADAEGEDGADGDNADGAATDADNQAGSSIVNNSSSSNNSDTTNNSQQIIMTGGGSGQQTTGGSGAGGNGSNDQDTDDGTTTPGDGSGTGTGSGTGNGNGSGTSVPANLERSISLRGTSSSVTSITVNYYIMDPESKFVSTYLLVSQVGAEDDEMRVGLSKSDTSVELRGLKPNTQYQITLGYDMYNVVDGESVLIENTNDTVKARTKAIESNVEITRITSDKLYFKVKLDSAYILDSARLALYGTQDTSEMPYHTLDVNVEKASSGSGWTGTIDLDVFQGNLPEQYVLVIENAVYDGEPVTLNAKCIVKNRSIATFIRNLLNGFD